MTVQQEKLRGGYFALLGAGFLGRMAWFGWRSIFVLFLIASVDQHGLGTSRENAFALFGFMVGGAYVSYVLGGLVADLFLGTYRAAILGSGFLVVGLGLLAVPMTDLLYPALGCLLVGTGLFRPAQFAIYGQLFDSRREKLTSGLTLDLLAVNLGAFAAPLVVSTIAEPDNWTAGFMVAASIQFLALAILWFMKRRLPRMSMAPVEAGSSGDGLARALMLVLIAVAIQFLMWFPVDALMSRAYEAYGNELNRAQGMTYMPALVALSLVFALLWYFFRMAELVRIAVGFAVMAASWSLLGYLWFADQISMAMLTIFFGSQVLGEVLVVPPLYSWLMQSTPRQYLTTTLGLVLASPAIIDVAVRYFREPINTHVEASLQITGMVLVAVITAIVLLAVRQRPASPVAS